MKGYIITSGSVFALLTLAHVWRIVAENRSLVSDSIFVSVTVMAAALSVWALLVLLGLKGR